MYAAKIDGGCRATSNAIRGEFALNSRPARAICFDVTTKYHRGSIHPIAGACQGNSRAAKWVHFIDW